MHKKSSVDTTLFYWNFLLYFLLGVTFSIPFWKTNFFDTINEFSLKHIFLGVGYLFIFILLPLMALSWTRIIFVVFPGKIKVIEWFGLRQKTYLLPNKKTLKVKNEIAPYRLRIFPVESKYNDFKTLYITTQEGRKLRIQSRYYRNFDELHLAIRRACC